MPASISYSSSWAKSAYNGVFTVTQSITVPAGSNQVLLLFRRCDKFETFSETVTYGGNAMTFLGASPAGANAVTRVWYRLAPTAGTADIVITTADQKNMGAYLALVVDGATQSAPAFTAEDKITVTTATSSATVAAGALAILGVGSNIGTAAADTGSTSIDLNVSTNSGTRYGSAVHRTGAAPGVTFGSSAQAGLVAVVITPIPTALAWTGTIGAQTNTAGSAITALATSSYVSGGTTPYTYSATGLPTGLSINSSTGSITGTPTTAGSYTTTVSVTDSAGSPATVSSNAFTWTINAPAATATTLSGPSGGQVGVASANFTAGANGTITGTVTITPSDGGAGGVFTPTTVAISAGTPTATFTYTPNSAGAKTISISDNGSLTDAASLTYTASAAAGALTVSGIRNGSGTLLASTSLPNVVVIQRSNRTLLLALTAQTTSGAGALTISSGALGAGTACMVVAFSDDGTAAGAWPATVV